MLSLSDIGRIFYGMSIAVLGLLTIYYKVFPYILLPPQYLTPGNEMISYISGALLVLGGLFIVLQKQTRLVSFLLGIALLLIFCFCFIPFMFSANANFRHLTEWENAEKELALAGGALIIAGCFSPKNKKNFGEIWGELIPIGAILYSIPIISFGILHFIYGKDVATMVPSWIPFHLFWIYFAGTALLGSGIAIILKIKPGLIAALLGLMIFIWFIILHIPDVIASSPVDQGDQVSSAFLALAYSGIAFVIAGASRKNLN
jgi:uncharacterized membrane protein